MTTKDSKAFFSSRNILSLFFDTLHLRLIPLIPTTELPSFTLLLTLIMVKARFHDRYARNIIRAHYSCNED